MSVINRKRVLAEFLQLVSFHCPSGAERQVADYVKSQLSAIGVTDVYEDKAGNAIGGNCGNLYVFLKASIAGRPSIMLSAHMDSVEPCKGVKPQLQDGVIRSSGDTILGADDKAGVVAIIEAFRVIQENKLPHGDITAVFTIAEEGGLKGSRNVEQDRLKADFGYALDSSGAPGKFIIQAPGQDNVNVAISGKTAHAGVAPEEGVNAIVLASKALSAMKLGRIDDETTANVGIIKGGQATNIVPDRVELKCEARSRNAEKLKAQTAHMKDTFVRVALENGGRAEVKIAREYEAYKLEEGTPVVSRMLEAAKRVGIKPQLEATGGGSDSNVFNAMGIPTAVIGMGMAKVHTTAEYIEEEHLYQGAELALALITEA